MDGIVGGGEVEDMERSTNEEDGVAIMVML
jgi:hypothetical protein